MITQVEFFTNSAEVKANVLDVRTEEQVNKKISYDVGAKIGGAKKDLAAMRKAFTEKMSAHNLEEIEKISASAAVEVINKENIFREFSLEKEKENGTCVKVAKLKHLLIKRIEHQPKIDTAEARKDFLLGAVTVLNWLNTLKVWDDVSPFVQKIYDQIYYENTDIDRVKEDIERNTQKIQSGSTRNVEYYKKKISRLNAVLSKALNSQGLSLSCLGDKFSSFFLSEASRNGTIKNISKNYNSWEDLLKQPSSKKQPKLRGPVWSRELPERPDRKGGRDSSVKKPEDLVSVFGLRAVEFGHYMEDQKGEEHLIRSSEALLDLADVMGVHEAKLSLKNRLSVSFGSRGRGRALAHYERVAKVINLTKVKGSLGVLAHEFFHGLDNYLFDCSHDFKNGVNDYISSQEYEAGQFISPAIQDAFNKLIKTITEGSALDYIDNTNPIDNPRVRVTLYLRRAYREYNGDLLRIMEDQKAILNSDREYALDYEYIAEEKKEKHTEKVNKKYQRDLKKTALALAYLHEKETGERVDRIPYYSENTRFYLNAMSLDKGIKKYWATNVELAARAFEAYVEDKLQEMNRKNDYLVCGTRNSLAFPVGNEREIINKSIEELLNCIKENDVL